MRAILFFAIFVSACAPSASIQLGTTPTPPADSTEAPREAFVTADPSVSRPPITFSVNFDDANWPMATMTCWDNYQPIMYFAEFNGDGWAYFSNYCESPTFNVASGNLQTGLTLNVNPYNVAEIVIDEGSDVAEQQDQPDLAPQLNLWVFTGEYEWGISEMYDPVTINSPDGSFWGCDEPEWFAPYGMPYARAPADADDYCETTR